MQLEHSFTNGAPMGSCMTPLHRAAAVRQYLHDEGHLVLLILSRKDGPASVQLSNDAAEAPHVDSHAIAVTEDDLRSAVIASLNVIKLYRQKHRPHR